MPITPKTGSLFPCRSTARTDAHLGLGDTGVGVGGNLLVSETPPQPLDEDVVRVAALAIHADGDPARCPSNPHWCRGKFWFPRTRSRSSTTAVHADPCGCSRRQ